MDSRLFSWVQLAEINHGASLPHELIAATHELAKKVNQPKSKDGEGKGKNKTNLKCPSWNTSETHDKCDWEVANATEQCNRVHECSWCKGRSLRPLNHQRSFCEKRLEEEDGE